MTIFHMFKYDLLLKFASFRQMPIHVIISPNNPKPILKNIANTTKCDIQRIDKDTNCMDAFVNNNNQSFHIALKSEHESLGSGSSYVKQLENINTLLDLYMDQEYPSIKSNAQMTVESTKGQMHLIISVTDPHNIPSYINERITYLYISNQKTSRSLTILYNNWFYTVHPDIKSLKKMFDENCHSDMHYFSLDLSCSPMAVYSNGPKI